MTSKSFVTAKGGLRDRLIRFFRDSFAEPIQTTMNAVTDSRFDQHLKGAVIKKPHRKTVGLFIFSAN